MIFHTKYDFIKHIIQFGIDNYPELIPRYNNYIVLFSNDLSKVLEKLYPLYLEHYNSKPILLF